MPFRTEIFTGSCLLLAAAGLLTGAEEIQIREGLPIVSARVNGHGPYRFLLDTGTRFSHFDPSMAVSIGLKPSLRIDVVSAASVSRAPAVQNIEIELGSEQASGQTLVLSKLETLQPLGRDVHGVLGQEFLSRFDYQLDLRARKIHFSPPPPAGPRVEFELLHNRPTVETSLGRLILDSGTSAVVLFSEPREHPAGSVFTLVGESPASTLPRKPLVIQGRTIHYPALIEIPGKNEAGAGGLLPLNLFKSVYVNNSDRYVVFE